MTIEPAQSRLNYAWSIDVIFGSIHVQNDITTKIMVW